MKCDICGFLNNSELAIIETKYWKVNIADDQAYLGRCYVILKRHYGSLSDLTKEEWIDFSSLVKKLESLYKKTFGAKLLNWSCLMNDAFRQNPANPHVHWHVRPRYDKGVEFAGMIFNDLEFGSHYVWESDRKNILSEDKLHKIVNELRKNL